MNEFQSITEPTVFTREIEADPEAGIPHQFQGLIYSRNKAGELVEEIVVVGARSKEDAGKRAISVLQDQEIEKFWKKSFKKPKKQNIIVDDDEYLGKHNCNNYAEFDGTLKFCSSCGKQL